MFSATYSTAQFKLNIYKRVTLVFLNKFVGPLASFTQAHGPISIFDP